MLYQKTLTGQKPFHAVLTADVSFEKHSHLECELVYCIEGECEALVGAEKFAINSGECVFVGSMHPHEYSCKGSGRFLVLEIGPSLLRHSFRLLASINAHPPVFEIDGEMRKCVSEIIVLLNGESADELMLVSDIYRICALTVKRLGGTEISGAAQKSDTGELIERALQLIYRDYMRPLTVEEAAQTIGYGKSNFCKIFKAGYGDSFHKVLNRHRVENACYFLSETDRSVEEIAESVGFFDVKTFYRVFKSVTGRTPGEYRK